MLLEDAIPVLYGIGNNKNEHRIKQKSASHTLKSSVAYLAKQGSTIWNKLYQFEEIPVQSRDFHPPVDIFA